MGFFSVGCSCFCFGSRFLYFFGCWSFVFVGKVRLDF